MMLDVNIKPIIVIDGRRLLAKAETHEKRARKRRHDDSSTSPPKLTPSIVRRFIRIARSLGVDVIVAPFEVSLTN